MPIGRSFLGLPHKILNINHKKELLRGLIQQASSESSAPMCPIRTGGAI